MRGCEDFFCCSWHSQKAKEIMSLVGFDEKNLRRQFSLRKYFFSVGEGERKKAGQGASHRLLPNPFPINAVNFYPTILIVSFCIKKNCVFFLIFGKLSSIIFLPILLLANEVFGLVNAGHTSLLVLVFPIDIFEFFPTAYTFARHVAHWAVGADCFYARETLLLAIGFS